MTMFSVKPPFDLAAFLAVPAKVGTAARRNGRRSAAAPAPEPEAETAPSETPAGDAAPADLPET